jgi:hypothetical protein
LTCANNWLRDVNVALHILHDGDDAFVVAVAVAVDGVVADVGVDVGAGDGNTRENGHAPPGGHNGSEVSIGKSVNAPAYFR